MQGLWSLKGTPLEPGWARPSLSLVWMVTIILLWIWLYKAHQNHAWPEFEYISAGIFLLLW